jgi:hypothetical protein
MATLLAALRATSRNRHRQAAGTSPAYLDALLAAFSGQVSPPSDTSEKERPFAMHESPSTL